MRRKDILLFKSLIEIYDIELEAQTYLHKHFWICSKCESLKKKRKDIIRKLQKESEGK